MPDPVERAAPLVVWRQKASGAGAADKTSTTKSADCLPGRLIFGHSLQPSASSSKFPCVSYWRIIHKLRGCGSRSVKTGTSGWPHLGASATLYQPSGSRKKESYEELFRERGGYLTIKFVTDIYAHENVSPLTSSSFPQQRHNVWIQATAPQSLCFSMSTLLPMNKYSF